jgi:hypothetical protein
VRPETSATTAPAGDAQPRSRELGAVSGGSYAKLCCQCFEQGNADGLGSETLTVAGGRCRFGRRHVFSLISRSRSFGF